MIKLPKKENNTFINTGVINLFRQFSKKEISDFGNFIRSPFYNNHSTLIKLFNELKRQFTLVNWSLKSILSNIQCKHSLQFTFVNWSLKTNSVKHSLQITFVNWSLKTNSVKHSLQTFIAVHFCELKSED